MAEMTGGDAVYEALRALGVEHVFGIVSIHNIPIYDAILRGGGITAVSVRHEQGAVHAADGYARATGKLGVAITSTGPGAANGMTGLLEAGFASSPVLMITGQVDTTSYGKGKGVLHEAENQLPMLRTVTRVAETVRRPEDVAQMVVRVAQQVRTGRPQPGAVEIPIDVQYARAEVDIPHIEAWPRIAPDRAALGTAINALNAARKVVIWAGGGVVSSGASGELVQLAEALRAPVVTTTNGRGAIPETHPLCVGALAPQPGIAELFAEADLVLAIGTRFQSAETREWKLAMPPQLVHIDADPAVIGRNYRPQVPVIGDARLAIAALIRGLDGDPKDAEFLSRAQQLRDAARLQMRGAIGADFGEIMDSMRAILPAEALVVRDATIPAYLWGNRLIPILEPRTSLHPTSNAIGPALPLAIGASIGSGKKAAIIQGDGGFMLNIGELATAVQYNVPIVVCVFNDRGYGILRTLEARAFDGRQIGTELATPDFAMVARGMGMHGETVRGVSEFKDAFARAVEAEGPVLLDIDMSTLAPMPGLAPPPRRD
jgi:acetolactate synthase-1/2/3 large subunit